MKTSTSTTPPATATALRSQLRADGFRPGIPAGLDPEVIALDVNTYRRQRCPRCGRRLDAAPFTDGSAYRLLCSCRCGFEVEC